MAEEEQENGTTGTLDMAKAHALEHTWTLWFDNPSQRTLDTYGQSLKTVYTFSTVEDFWRLYNNLLPPSRLNHGTDFHLFKQGIEPKWEDANCEKGGKWLFTLSRERNKDIDAIWEELLLSLIGERFSVPSEVCGGVVNIRKSGNRVGLWTRTASKQEEQQRLGRELKKTIGLDDTKKISFTSHYDSMLYEKNAKPKYSV